MKIVAYLIIILLIAGLVFFDYTNISVETQYFMFSKVDTALLPMITTVAFLAGTIAGSMYYFISLIESKKTAIAQNRRVEKISVDKESADFKIKTLEAKIETLETALKKMLSDKEQ